MARVRRLQEAQITHLPQTNLSVPDHCPLPQLVDPLGFLWVMALIELHIDCRVRLDLTPHLTRSVVLQCSGNIHAFSRCGVLCVALCHQVPLLVVLASACCKLDVCLVLCSINFQAPPQ